MRTVAVGRLLDDAGRGRFGRQQPEKMTAIAAAAADTPGGPRRLRPEKPVESGKRRG